MFNPHRWKCKVIPYCPNCSPSRGSGPLNQITDSISFRYNIQRKISGGCTLVSVQTSSAESAHCSFGLPFPVLFMRRGPATACCRRLFAALSDLTSNVIARPEVTRDRGP